MIQVWKGQKPHSLTWFVSVGVDCLSLSDGPLVGISNSSSRLQPAPPRLLAMLSLPGGLTVQVGKGKVVPVLN
jgi:hypothetical protein